MIDNSPPSLFGILVLSLGNAALMGLGEVPDPETQKALVNLEQAQYNIELLAMLCEKTKGNLNHDESQMLEGLLYDLRVKFVDAKKRP